MQKKIRFNNSKGQKLSGILNIPEGKGPFPGVVVCHGFGGNKNRPLIEAISEGLEKQGIAALRFDFTGNGESEGKISQGTYTQLISDAKKAVTSLRNQKGIDKEKIGIAGHSMGGATAILTTAADKRIRCAVTLAPVARTHEYKKHYGLSFKMLKALKNSGLVTLKHGTDLLRLRKNFFDDHDNHNVLDSARKIKVPVLLIHAKGDRSVEVEDSKDIIEALGGEKKLIITDTKTHSWWEPGMQKKVAGYSARFFKKHLMM